MKTNIGDWVDCAVLEETENSQPYFPTPYEIRHKMRE